MTTPALISTTAAIVSIINSHALLTIPMLGALIVVDDCFSKTKDVNFSRTHSSLDYQPSPPDYSYSSRANMIRACKSTSSVKSWIFDSACTEVTEHMTSEYHYFESYTGSQFSSPIPVNGIGSNTLFAKGQGTVCLQSSDHPSATHRLCNVWFVPGLDDSIIFKHWIKYDDFHLSIDKDQNFVLKSTQLNSTFTATTNDVNRITVFPTLRAITQTPRSLRLITQRRYLTLSSQLLHERLGHASTDTLRLLGISYQPGKCDSCILGKQTRSPFPRIQRSSAKLFRVYLDHCGPITPPSYGNALYALAIIDEATGYSWIYCVPDKSSTTTLNVLKRWKPMVENQSGGNTLKFMLTDQAKEFTGINTLIPYLESCGIVHETYHRLFFLFQRYG